MKWRYLKRVLHTSTLFYYNVPLSRIIWRSNSWYQRYKIPIRNLWDYLTNNKIHFGKYLYFQVLVLPGNMWISSLVLGKTYYIFWFHFQEKNWFELNQWFPEKQDNNRIWFLIRFLGKNSSIVIRFHSLLVSRMMNFN